MARPRNKFAHRDPFQVRMNPKEKQELEEAARLSGLQVSTWMRVICLEAARAKKAARAAVGVTATA
jgi:uncharacterized protein (DUF1778 family)